MKTEDEAKACWCPKKGSREAVLYVAGPNPTAEETAAAYKLTRCAASECVWWRWETERIVYASLDQLPSESRADSVSTNRGYCGIAGIPKS